MKKEAVILALFFIISSVSSVIAVGSSTGNSNTNSNAAQTPSITNPVELTFTVGPKKVDCMTLVPTKCLFVNGGDFYLGIIGFDYEEGYEYVIRVIRRQVYTEQNVPADAGLYEFTLKNVISKTPARTTCEDITTIRERIKCRFQNKAVARAESSTAVEEACRNQARQAACTALYQRSASCYDISSPPEKKRCFLEKAGININAGGTFRAAPDDTKRNYVVLLLYELQERIELMEERGTISTDDAASLVTQIVEIKKLILEGKPRSEIVPKIQQFKQDYRTIVIGEPQ